MMLAVLIPENKTRDLGFKHSLAWNSHYPLLIKMPSEGISKAFLSFINTNNTSSIGKDFNKLLFSLVPAPPFPPQQCTVAKERHKGEELVPSMDRQGRQMVSQPELHLHSLCLGS